MAKTPRNTIFEIGDETIRAGWGGRAARVPFTREDDTLVVDMDAVDAWDDGAELSLDDLGRLLALIERECDARDVEVEFE